MTDLEERLRGHVVSRLSRRRLEHVEGVVETIDSLARMHGISREDCRAVAWLHDCAKEEPPESFRQLIMD